MVRIHFFICRIERSSVMKRRFLGISVGCIVLVCLALLLLSGNIDQSGLPAAPVSTATPPPSVTPTVPPSPTPTPTPAPTPSPVPASNLTPSGAASQVIPSPTPTSSVFLDVGFLSSRVQVDVSYTNKLTSQIVQFSPDQELSHSQVNGMYADGILFFQGVEEFVKTADIRSVPLTEDFSYRVNFSEGVNSSSCSHRLYQQTNDGLVMLEGSREFVFGQDTLSSGTYLLKIDFSLSYGGGYYSGCSFVWLTAE